MSGFQTGPVQAVSKNPNVFNTQYGPKYNLKFKMPDGQWYILKFCDPNEDPPLHRGMQVSFQFDVETRPNPQGGQYVDNVVNKKTLNYGGGPQPMQQGYQQQGYQQQAPQPQQPAPNWQGKEGMVTGMALQCACSVCSDFSQVPSVAAQIILLQQYMMDGMSQRGAPFLQQMVGQAKQQPSPNPEANVPEGYQQMPSMDPQPAGSAVPQPGQPASMVPKGFDGPPPQ